MGPHFTALSFFSCFFLELNIISLVAAPAGPGRTVLGAIDADRSRTVALSVTRALPHSGPLVIDRLECHPHSSQTFLPLTVERWLVVVAAEPDASALRAFLVGPGTGVVIGRGIWHHGLTVLGTPAAFAVVMGRTDPNTASVEDDEWAEIDPAAIAL